MKNFVYQLPTKSLFGRGAENEVGREVRALGGALFCDRRFNRVFTFHNGAESYYASGGFRRSLRV